MKAQLKKNKHARIVKSPFGYFGSKHRIALPLIKYIPPHNAWVDAFCGSAAVTFAKSPAQIEIINDINGEIVNFFRQLRRNGSELCREIAMTPYAKEELFSARLHKKNLSSLERARRFLVSSMMAINGIFGEEKGGFSFSNSYARNGKEARVSRWYNLPVRLEAIVERLRNIRIEHKDARELIKGFLKRPATLLYLDPPYFAERTQGYEFDQNNEKFHKELLKLVCKAKCMVMISSYNSELYESILTSKLGWKQIKIATHTQGSNGKRMTRTEILWLNKNCIDAKRSQIVPVVLSKKEKKTGKVNPIK
ncbi:MAG: DNA adenine methylase [Candidatus Omnitrophica bacterium]|nr:DNA adenine methylase [Candidatus Omnitrophota bacterium]